MDAIHEKLFDLKTKYEALFGEGSGYSIPEPYCPKDWPITVEDIIELYETCLNRKCKWEVLYDPSQLFQDDDDIMY